MKFFRMKRSVFIVAATVAALGALFALATLAGCEPDNSTNPQTTSQTTSKTTTPTATATTSTAATTDQTDTSDSSGTTTADQSPPPQTPQPAASLEVVKQGATTISSQQLAGIVPPGSQVVLFAENTGDATGVSITMGCYGVGNWNIDLVKKTTTAGVSHWSSYWTVPSTPCSCRYRASATDGVTTVEYWEGGLSASSYPLEVKP